MTRNLILLTAVSALAACSGMDSETTLRQHGYTDAYVSGYHDGCPSGRQAGGDYFSNPVRNETAYQDDADYQTGWDYGFIKCRNETELNLAVASAIGDSIAAGASNHGADGVDTRKIMRGIDQRELRSSLKAAGW